MKKIFYAILFFILTILWVYWVRAATTWWALWDNTFELTWYFAAWQKLLAQDLNDIQDNFNLILPSFNSDWTIKSEKTRLSNWDILNTKFDNWDLKLDSIKAWTEWQIIVVTWWVPTWTNFADSWIQDIQDIRWNNYAPNWSWYKKLSTHKWFVERSVLWLPVWTEDWAYVKTINKWDNLSPDKQMLQIAYNSWKEFHRNNINSTTWWTWREIWWGWSNTKVISWTITSAWTYSIPHWLWTTPKSLTVNRIWTFTGWAAALTNWSWASWSQSNISTLVDASSAYALVDNTSISALNSILYSNNKVVINSVDSTNINLTILAMTDTNSTWKYVITVNG